MQARPTRASDTKKAHIQRRFNVLNLSCHQRFGEVDLGVPQLCQERQSQLSRCEPAQYFLAAWHQHHTHTPRKTRVPYVNGDKVLERLAHLQTFDVQVTRMQEIVHPRMAVVICLVREGVGRMISLRVLRTHLRLG